MPGNSFSILSGILLIILRWTLGNHVVFVDKSGVDTSDCLSRNATKPCLTLDFVFGNSGEHKISNKTKIIIGSGTYYLQSNAVFEYYRDITIEGVQEDQVVIQCNSSAKNIGWKFQRCRGISFRNLVITKCRFGHSSTTKSHPKLYSGIFIVYSKDIAFENVSFNNNTGIGVTLFDVAGVVNFTGVIFFGNRDRGIDNGADWEPLTLRTTATRMRWMNLTFYMESGGGLYVQFTTCGAVDPFSCTSLQEQQRYNRDSIYIFKNCIFKENVAEHRVGLRYGIKLDEQNAFGRGGGLTFLFTGGAKNNSLFIDDCTFNRNKASWGAGYYIGLHDSAQANKILVNRSNISHNEATMGGGGGRIVSSFPNQTQNIESNVLRHSECYFEGNRAIWGGGISLTGTTRISPYIYSLEARATFLTDSQFVGNYATVGSAIGLNTRNLNNNTVGPGLSYVLLMENCDFVRNRIIRTEDKTVIGEGAMYSDEVTLFFRGLNRFYDNNGTALVLDSSSVSVHDVLLFEENYGIDGGALAVYGNSWVMLHKSCNLTFVRNKAASKGGAIYVKTPGPQRIAFDTTELETGDCFFKYADQGDKFQPDSWDCTVNFFNNTAAVASGNAVYASTLQHCRRIHERRDHSSALYWKPFHYTSCGNGQPEVVTNPIKISFDPSEWYKPPGLRFSPKLVSRDEKNNSVYGTIKVIIKAKKEKKRLLDYNIIGSEFNDLSDGDDDNDDHDVEIFPQSALFLTKDRIETIEITGKEGTPFTYQFLTTAGQVIKTDIYSNTLAGCPPGYVQLEGETNCICMSKTKEQRGVSRCDYLKVYLQPGFWAALDHEGDLYTVPCPEHYCFCCPYWSNLTNSHCQVSGHLAHECQLNLEKQCRGNRTGPLCGQCRPGMSVKLGSEECAYCSNLWLLLLLPMAIVGLLVVLLILYFDINAFSGYLNGFMFSYQVITMLLADSVILDPFIGLVIGATSLSGTGNGQIGVCLYDGFDNLQKLGFNYVLPFYLILCTVFIGLFLPEKMWNVVFGRWKVLGDNGRSTSFGHAISFVSVVSYSAFTSATLNILHRVKLDGQQRVFQAAHVVYFGQEHLPYAILAIFVLLTIVLGFPILLIFTPYFTARFRWILRLEPALTALKNCFQDRQRNNNERRAFAAFYFICRLIILSVGVFVQEEITRLVTVTISVILMQSIFSWFQPYKKWTMNLWDTLLLTNLSVIGTLSILLTIPNYLPVFSRVILTVLVQAMVYLPLITIVIRGLIVLNERRTRQGGRSFSDNTGNDGTMLTEPSSLHGLSAPLVQGKKSHGSRQPDKLRIPPRVLEDYGSQPRA